MLFRASILARSILLGSLSLGKGLLLATLVKEKSNFGIAVNKANILVSLL